MVLIRLRVQGADLPLTEGIVECRVDLVRRDVQARSGRAIDGEIGADTVILLIGRDAPEFAAILARHGVKFDMVGTLEAAVPAAFDAATSENVPVVLLSPACASWDQFTGYDQRGQRFAELARCLRAASFAVRPAAWWSCIRPTSMPRSIQAST